MSDIERIIAAHAPPPGGHYSQAVRWGELIFVSGQLPVRADGSHAPDADFETQCRQALNNLFAVLAAAGSTPDQVLKITAYIVGVGRWPEFNRIYAQMFGDARPARSVVPISELHYGYLVEIDAVAVPIKKLG